jgi:hypothetical protein
MSKASKHVVPNASGGWAVRNSGAARASRKFDTQAEAVEYARTQAKKEHTELYVHGRDGSIQSKLSYSGISDSQAQKHK